MHKKVAVILDPFSSIRPALTHLNDSFLAPLDGFAEIFLLMTLQTLVEQLLERVHGIVHFLQQQTQTETDVYIHTQTFAFFSGGPALQYRAPMLTFKTHDLSVFGELNAGFIRVYMQP